MYTLQDIQSNECLNYELTKLDEQIFAEAGFVIYSLDADSKGITYKDSMNPGCLNDIMITYLPNRDSLTCYKWFYDEQEGEKVEIFDEIPYEELFKEKSQEYRNMSLVWG